jgi:hypothetical protein
MTTNPTTEKRFWTKPNLTDLALGDANALKNKIKPLEGPRGADANHGPAS